ncbi:hypothetical protein KAFR_0D03280 [Kazachstania africana CBS 2517]|uniref:Ras-GAP domain-containing protein n=1 Tax=Kazachstania africana (strain ATCC 22294 / BCRC 22015 / CBS 2517 / CECT 1963 / NBRC 1671 / NRRL Y-8276) TaxID=1071382 RepID=H2AUC6_KAZAF|nr:hypothetical protein KAFR_0D03280 [Kazachstania africana CBS 2517]CCF57976.1 hypothetical protein KAFR_0D03280 [Kazachstania africana CBS 2517]
MNTSTDNRNDQMRPFSLNDFRGNIIKMKGRFIGKVRWCREQSPQIWQTDCLEITSAGALKNVNNSVDSVSMDNTVMSSTSTNDASSSSGYIMVAHLQQCTIKLIRWENSIPTCELGFGESGTGKIYTQLSDASKFYEFFSALTWWSSYRAKGLFNKLTLNKSECVKQQSGEKIANLLVCQLNVFGPIVRNKNIQIIDNLEKPDLLFKEKNMEAWGWFPSMGVLKSNGTMDFLLQNDGTLLYSVDITKLLRSEIRALDYSLLMNDSCLFLGILSSLRNQLSVSTENGFFLGYLKNRLADEQLILRFPLKIDQEDWFIALKSFAIPERFSLIASDSSNSLRLSNKFDIGILEADLEAVELDAPNEKPAFYSLVSMWDHAWAKTPIISNTKPFWREEFNFHESLLVESIYIQIMQKVRRGMDKMVGLVKITQAMLSDPVFQKETRVPLYLTSNPSFQVGTICIKINSTANFVLPPTNYAKLERFLSIASLPKIANDVYKVLEVNHSLKLEEVSSTCLDVFQLNERLDEWFQTLIERELSTINKSIYKNSHKNLTSSHIYNSLFRGNSIMTKTTEKYFFRIGNEYLNKSIGAILREIIDDGKSCEIDPSRISKEVLSTDSSIIKQNRKRLITWVKKIWKLIYSTSNDLPPEIRSYLKSFRMSLEKVCAGDESTILNCISGILFLRFFCPVILNPKLFKFTEHHLNDTTRRTLTLLSKTLMNLSTLTLFGKKEPWMIDINSFIEGHKSELLTYVDRVTDRKLDFSTKTLKLQSGITRPKLLMSNFLSKELQSSSYLIDKYLKETEFIYLLNMADNISHKNSDNQNCISQDLSINDITSFLKNASSLDQKNAQIGELEFEKLTENNTEIFGKDLLQYLVLNDIEDDEAGKNSRILDPTSDEVEYSTKQLLQESSLLCYKLQRLIKVLSDYEYPSEVILRDEAYLSLLAKQIYFTKDKRIYICRNNSLTSPKEYFNLFDSSLPNQDVAPLLFDSSSDSGNFSIPSSRCSGSENVRTDGSKNYISGNSNPSRSLSRLTSTKISRFIRVGSSNNIKGQLKQKSDGVRKEDYADSRTVNNTSRKSGMFWFMRK